MSKRWFATLLIGLGLLALLPFLPQAWAFATAKVDLSAAATSVTGTPLITCQVPGTINVDGRVTTITGDFVRCTNNYGGTVTIAWSGNASGTSFLLDDTGPSPCRNVTITYPKLGNKVNGTAVLTAVAASADGEFRAEVQFVANLYSENNPKDPGGGCP